MIRALGKLGKLKVYHQLLFLLGIVKFFVWWQIEIYFPCFHWKCCWYFVLFIFFLLDALLCVLYNLTVNAHGIGFKFNKEGVVL